MADRSNPIFAHDPIMIPAYQRESGWLREDIAGLQEELRYAEQRVADIQTKEIPDLVKELIRRRCEVEEFTREIANKQQELDQKESRHA